MKARRQPKALITATAAANILGYESGKTIKRMREEGRLKGYRRPDAGPTTPWMFARRDIEALKERMAAS
jgi:hypothetical protein